MWDKILFVVHHTMKAAKWSVRAMENNWSFYGADFIFDEHLNPYLLEIQPGPDLESNCVARAELIPLLFQEIFRILEVIHSDGRGKVREMVKEVLRQIQFGEYEAVFEPAYVDISAKELTDYYYKHANRSRGTND